MILTRFKLQFVNSSECDKLDDEESNTSIKYARYFSVRHTNKSTISQVGLQIWRGSLVMADYLIHRSHSLSDTIIIELGSGCGVIGVILGLLNNRVSFATDFSAEVLGNLEHNISSNLHLVPLAVNRCPVQVKRVDWMANSQPLFLRNNLNIRSDISINIATDFTDSDPYRWTIADIDLLRQSRVLCLGADVTYDEKLTVAFFNTVAQILRPDEHLWISVEKRTNFSASELKLVTTSYRLFLNIVHANGNSNITNDNNTDISNKAVDSDRHYLYKTSRYGECAFKRRKQFLNFPQVLYDYDRVKELEIWDISFKQYLSVVT